MTNEELDDLELAFTEVPQLWGIKAERLVVEYRKLRDALTELGIELVDDEE